MRFRIRTLLLITGAVGVVLAITLAIWSTRQRHFESRKALSDGMAKEAAKQFDDALTEYSRAISLDPKYVDAYFSRSSLWVRYKEDYPKAIADLSTILRIIPLDYPALFNRGLYHEHIGQYDQAIADFSQALDSKTNFTRVDATKIDEHRAHALHYRGKVFQYHNKEFERAIEDYTESLRLDPKCEMIHYRRGVSYQSLRQFANAEQDFATEYSIQPTYPNLLAKWAWQLATCPNADFRNGTRAVELAEVANTVFEMKVPEHVDVLAAAYAEVGDLDKAIEFEQKAIAIVNPKSENLRAAMKNRLELYEKGKPFRDE